MSPLVVALLATGLVGAGYYVATRKPNSTPHPESPTAGRGPLNQGRWYRIRGNADLVWEAKIRAASGGASQKILETQLRGDLTSSGVFDDVRFAAQDPSKQGLWIFIARAARSGELPALEHVSLASAEEVEPPPATRESEREAGSTYDPPRVLDAGMVYQDARALSYALARDEDPKHLFALADAYGSDYPVAAGLLLLKGALVSQAKTTPSVLSTAPASAASSAKPSTANMLRRLSNAGVTQAAKRFAGGNPINFESGGVFETVSDVASTGEKILKDVKDQLPGPAKDAVSLAEDQFKNAIQSPLYRSLHDRLTSFAQSEVGQMCFRAMATAAGASLVWAGAPFFVASLVWALPGILRDEPFDQAYLVEFMWRVETTAKVLGADIQQKFSEELSRVLTLLNQDMKAGHPEVTQLPIAELAKRYGAPGAPVREDVIAYALALIKRSMQWLQNLGDFDPKTGKLVTAKDRALQSVEQVSPKPAFVKKYLQLVRASQSIQARAPALSAPALVQSAVTGMGPAVIAAFQRYLPVLQSLGPASPEPVRASPEEALARIASFRREDIERIRGLVYDMLRDRSLRTQPLEAIAAAKRAPTALVETAREMIRELPGGLALADADRMRRILPDGPKPVSPSALLLVDASTRPGRSVTDDTEAAKARVLQITDGAKRGDPDAVRALDELRRAQQAVNRQKWTESLARIEQGQRDSAVLGTLDLDGPRG